MTKTEQYDILLRQVKELREGCPDSIALMANTAALLHETMGFWWTGFYRVDGMSLILGPFQGPLACTVIPYGRGVCGTAWKERHTVVVPDVEQFPGHIACSSESRSEIVVPVWDTAHEQILAVLDIDSRHLATFDAVDAEWLEKICAVLAPEDTLQSLATEIGEALRTQGLTIVTAESCTAGGIAHALAQVEGASQYLRGGFVTYQTPMKTELLDVSAVLIDTCGVVSAEVAQAMAQGALSRTEADIAVAVTGYIGAQGGDAHAPNGTVWYCIITPQASCTHHLHVHSCRRCNMQDVVRTILATLKNEIAP